MNESWTVLIYANGNCDMEPEIYRSLLDSEKICSKDEVTVLMQIGRAHRSITKKLRPFCYLGYEQNLWSGVRRYYVNNPSSILLQDLGNINMADPMTLYEFIKWGIKNYKADHYILVLSGHGMSFVGGLTDLTFNLFYHMGIPEMSTVIKMAKTELNCEFEVLILDMCYMNTVEIMCELGNQEISSVKTVITYIEKGPFSGLPYDKLIQSIQNLSSTKNTEVFCKKLIDSLSMNLIAFQINHEKLEKIKKAFNDLAYNYFQIKDENIKSPNDLICGSNISQHLYKYRENINNELTSIIIYYNSNNINHNNLISITAEELGTLIPVYCKLSFAKNNYWTKLLSSQNLDSYLNKKIELKPIPFSKTASNRLILNCISSKKIIYSKG